MRSPRFLGARPPVDGAQNAAGGAFASMIERLLPPDFRAQIEGTITSANASMAAIQSLDARMKNVEVLLEQIAHALHVYDVPMPQEPKS